MGGEINPQKLFNKDVEDIEEIPGKEPDYGPQRAILGSDVTVFLEDYRGKIGYKIPERKKVEVFFVTIKDEGDRKPPPVETKLEKEKAEKGEEDGRIYCRVMSFYGENEEGEDIKIKNLNELGLEGVEGGESNSIKLNDKIWCYPEDLEKNLRLKEEQKEEQEEEESEIIEPEEKIEGMDQGEKYREIVRRSRKPYRPPYPDD